MEKNLILKILTENIFDEKNLIKKKFRGIKNYSSKTSNNEVEKL